MKKKLTNFFVLFGILLKIVSVNLKSLINLRRLNNYYSEIYLIVQGRGSQELLYKNYVVEPSEVIINGVKNNSCKKTCYLTEDKNNITLRFNNQIKTCYYMFYSLKNITEVDLSNFDASKVLNFTYMFGNCSNLEKIIFGKINTSSVEKMSSMFNSCTKLTSLDLSSFDTSKVTTMYAIFNGCENLEKIIFGKINTSSVENMRSMFNSCNKLISLDLSNFDTSKVTTMVKMFDHCKKLKFLDLSNFNTSKITNMYKMFYHCEKLIYLNLYSFKIESPTNKSSIIVGISSYVKYCIKDISTKNYLLGNEVNSECDDDCFKENIKLDINNNTCIQSCKINGYEYEYNNICYNECPRDSYEVFCEGSKCDEETKICFDKTIEGYYLDTSVNKLKKCYDTCKYCSGQGSEIKHYCLECKDNYIFLDESDYKTNCYSKCENYYYFDKTNKYSCSSVCNGEYTKKVIQKNKCIEDCKKDDTYKYEFNSICYKECPSETYQLEDNNDKKCYDENPEVYYLDISNKIYRKCYEKCSKCNKGGDENNNNCLECKYNYKFYINRLNISNCYQQCENYYYFDDSNNFYCTNNLKCPDNYNKLIKEKNKCIDDCSKDDIYKYEKNNICYKDYPHDTIQIIIDNDSTFPKSTIFYFVDNRITNYYSSDIKLTFENFINTIDVSHSEEGMINNESTQKEELFNLENLIFDSSKVVNYTNYSILEIQNQILENFQELFHKGLNTTNIDKGNDYIITKDKVSYTITTTSNQKNNFNTNVSTINLGQCEDKLKYKYNIPKNNDLYILKIDTLINNVPKLEYEIYYPFTENNFTKLNLSICKNIKIDISIPIEIPIDELDKYNKSSGLYNDICYTLTSESGTDKPLIDRRNEFKNNNKTVCEEDCDFTDYDTNNKKAICSCFTKMKFPLISEIKVDKEKMFSNFKDIKNIGNFKMLKCRYLLFDKNNFLKNSANFMIVILFLISIIALFSYICYNNSKVKIYIMKLSFIKVGNKKYNNKKTINNNIRNNINKNKKKENISTKINNNVNKRRNNSLNIQRNINQQQKIRLNKPNRLRSKRPVFMKFFNINSNPVNRKQYINNNYKYNNRKQNKYGTFNLQKRKNLMESIHNKKINNIIKTATHNLNIKIKNNNNDLYKNKKVSNILKNNSLLNYNDEEMNSLNYQEAKSRDKRSYCQYYISLLRTKHILIFSFCQMNDYNSQAIKIYLFFLTFGINYLVSAMFYSEDTMHKIYTDKGSFDFTYQLPQMCYSFLISTLLNAILNTLGLYDQNIISFKKEKNKAANKEKVLSMIKCKIALFFIVTYILLFFLWIYLGCFCAVYKNTQIHLLLEVASSFGLSFITPFFLYLLPGMFRISSLKNEVNRPLMFKFSKFLQFL